MKLNHNKISCIKLVHLLYLVYICWNNGEDADLKVVVVVVRFMTVFVAPRDSAYFELRVKTAPGL